MTLYEELKARGLVAQITDDEIIDVINNGIRTELKLLENEENDDNLGWRPLHGNGSCHHRCR